jgi:hypothetical protein
MLARKLTDTCSLSEKEERRFNCSAQDWTEAFTDAYLCWTGT